MLMRDVNELLILGYVVNELARVCDIAEFRFHGGAFLTLFGGKRRSGKAAGRATPVCVEDRGYAVSAGQYLQHSAAGDDRESVLSALVHGGRQICQVGVCIICTGSRGTTNMSGGSLYYLHWFTGDDKYVPPVCLHELRQVVSQNFCCLSRTVDSSQNFPSSGGASRFLIVSSSIARGSTALCRSRG